MSDIWISLIENAILRYSSDGDFLSLVQGYSQFWVDELDETPFATLPGGANYGIANSPDGTVIICKDSSLAVDDNPGYLRVSDDGTNILQGNYQQTFGSIFAAACDSKDRVYALGGFFGRFSTEGGEVWRRDIYADGYAWDIGIDDDDGVWLLWEDGGTMSLRRYNIDGDLLAEHGTSISASYGTDAAKRMAVSDKGVFVIDGAEAKIRKFNHHGNQVASWKAYEASQDEEIRDVAADSEAIYAAIVTEVENEFLSIRAWGPSGDEVGEWKVTGPPLLVDYENVSISFDEMYIESISGEPSELGSSSAPGGIVPSSQASVGANAGSGVTFS